MATSANALKLYDQQVEHCVELICQKGCRQTRVDLKKLQFAEDIEEVQHLSAHQRQAVIEELTVIMSVYGDSCSI